MKLYAMIALVAMLLLGAGYAKRTYDNAILAATEGGKAECRNAVTQTTLDTIVKAERENRAAVEAANAALRKQLEAAETGRKEAEARAAAVKDEARTQHEALNKLAKSAPGCPIPDAAVDTLNAQIKRATASAKGGMK